MHDALPSLPRNALRSAKEEEAGALRTEIARLSQLVRTYEERLPPSSGGFDSRASPSAVITATRDLVERKKLPSDLLRNALSAYDSKDVSGFVRSIEDLIGSEPDFTSNDYRLLANRANLLNLRRVATAVLEFGTTQLPEDASLQEDYLSNLCHSPRSEDREPAIETLLTRAVISVREDGQVEIGRTPSSRDLRTIGLVLDALHRGNEDQKALNITTALMAKLPDDARVVRLHARALESVGRTEEGLATYRQTVGLDTVDNVCAVWLGNTLNNNGDFADAAEAYAVACLLDLDESSSYGHLLDAIFRGLYGAATGEKRGSRAIPASVSEAILTDVLDCFLSCSALTIAEVADLVQERPKAASLGLRAVTDRYDGLAQGQLQPIEERDLGVRRQVVERVYKILRSPLTDSFASGSATDSDDDAVSTPIASSDAAADEADAESATG